MSLDYELCSRVVICKNFHCILVAWEDDHKKVTAAGFSITAKNMFLKFECNLMIPIVYNKNVHIYYIDHSQL